MPRPKRGPRIYTRPDRPGYYAYLDRSHRHISLGTTDEKEAEQAFATLLKKRGGICQLATGEETLAVLFSMVRERAETNHTPKTVYELHRNLTRVLKWCESRNVYAPHVIDLALIEDYKTSRRFDKVSAARINRELDSWIKAMRFAVGRKWAQPDIVEAAFVKLREPRPVPHQRGLSKRQLDAFLKAAKHPGYRALFRMTLGTAMRDEETKHFDVTDLRRSSVVVTPKPAGACECCPDGWTTKGYRYREIPVSPTTIKAAKEFLRHRASMNLEAKAVWRIFSAACKAAGVPHASMHDLRRAWASHMLAAGHKIHNISRWLGHADVLTTMRYLRIVEHEMPKGDTLPW